jgi:hypothetical protein
MKGTTMPLGFFLFDPRLFDPMYWLLIGPTILLALYAQMKVKSAYGYWMRVGNRSGLTGAEAAHEVLRREGLGEVRIERTSGMLSDHFDPKENVLRLSSEVYDARSVAAIAIAAHEAGHALQHGTGSVLMSLRSFIAPLAIVSNAFIPIALIGIFFQWQGMVLLGVAGFSAIVLFQLVTLPVEFDASSRAKDQLLRSGIVQDEEEAGGVRSVLSAAALTYVAATLQAVMQLLWFLMRAGLLGGRDE